MPPVTRRQFFEKISSTRSAAAEVIPNDPIFAKYANKQPPAGKQGMSISLNEYEGPWGIVQIRHLINRTTFGIRQRDIDQFSSMSMSSAVDSLLSTPSAPLVPPVNNYGTEGLKDGTGVMFGDTWVNSNYGGSGLNFTRCLSFKSWWIGRLLAQDLNIAEKMTFFWHNHFATQALVLEDARYSYFHYRKLWARSLGNFKELVRDITVDPAMLLYLNGYLNTKNQPDENYARELQELFTLGKGNNPNYNEDDVKSAAKVLTGWYLNSSVLDSYFVPKRHDTSDKKFSSFFGNKVIKGRTGSDGAIETDELIDMIFEKSETAHFICTKLYRFFVYYNITEDIDRNIIAPLADLLIASNFEIKPVMLKLLKSEHFYDINNIGCYIKTPLDFVVGMLRSLEANLPNASMPDSYRIWINLNEHATTLGINLGDPPNVAGWPAFSQSPEFYQCWINSTTLPARMEFSDKIVMGGIDPGTGSPFAADVVKFVNNCPYPDNADGLVRWIVNLLYSADISESHISSFVATLLSGQANPAYWTEAWNNYIVDPAEENTGVVTGRLQQLMIAILRLPEFQLC